MKIFIVTNGCYEDYHIEKVFLSKVKAEEFVAGYDAMKLKENIEFYAKIKKPLPNWMQERKKPFSIDVEIEEYDVE